jgi:hypothetical protein
MMAKFMLLNSGPAGTGNELSVSQTVGLYF